MKMMDAESYLKSGSNEVRILEYRVGNSSFGINILKVNKIISKIALKTATPDSHPCVRGIFEDRGRVVPIIDLARFLGLPPIDEKKSNKIIVTEFFEVSNGFLVERVDWIHHFKWEDVIDANGVLGNFDHRYILGMVKPTEDHIVLLLDYETIILDLCPNLHQAERNILTAGEFDAAGRRILVAEDSSSVREMLAVELGEMGFEVLTVSDGIEALNTLKLDPEGFAMVVSDVEMPRMDGLALTVAIRNGEAKCKSNLPVIVYSSIGDLGMKTRAEYLKADAHVTKLNIEELFAKIQTIFASPAQATATTENDDLSPEAKAEETAEPELV